jgi:mannose-1-phosphate guanylyltransferase
LRGVIIAGGFGTRLRPLTLRRPKPLIPVANRPFLEYQVAQLKAAGADEIVFATNYLAERIEAHFGDGSRFGVRMRYAVETEPLGTAGAIRNAVEGLPPDRAIVFNGDILTDFDIGAIVRQHLENRAAVTLTLHRVNRPHPYGVIPVAEDGRVQAFLEPTEEQKRAADRGEPMERQRPHQRGHLHPGARGDCPHPVAPLLD